MANTENRRIYIAGPMRGIPKYNYPTFDRVAGTLRKQGAEAVSPADLDREAGFNIDDLPGDWDWNGLPPGWDMNGVIERDLKALKECAAIWMLDGWQNSVGATAEYHLAKWLGLNILGCAARVPSTLPTAAEDRKRTPVASGVLDYFPNAIAAVAHCSWVGNEQHNPGEPLHWSREKSSDHADCLIRHFMQRGTVDSDQVRHTTKAAWRALALLQTEIEQAHGKGI